VTAPTTEDRIKISIALQAGRAPSEIENTKTLRQDLQLDSLDLVELGMELEEEFDLHADVTNEDLRAMVTVQDMINYVTQRAVA
jgi:acyl carrier protein